jgi:hypothetical protein
MQDKNNPAAARLRRVRWAVRATLMLGVAASVVANVLHALDNPISQTIAAWPPLALLLTVELISRVPVHTRSLAFVRLLATAAIAGIAAWVSYWHMVGVAARYGETGASPYLLPLSVDGLIVVASICLVELGRDVAQRPAEQASTAHIGPVYDYDRPIGPMPVPIKAATERATGTSDSGDSAGQRQRQDARSEQDREAVVCAMRAANPAVTLREISTATLVPVSTVRNILARAAARQETPTKTNGRVPELVSSTPTPQEN